MSQVIKLKRGLSAQATALTLVAGEPAVCTDNGDFYVGTSTGKVKVNKITSVNGKEGVVVIDTITGNSGTSTKLATARTITMAGMVSGSTTFDGSANVTINTTLSSSFEIDGGTF